MTLPIEFDGRPAKQAAKDNAPGDPLWGVYFVKGAAWQFDQLKPIIDKQAEQIKVLREHLERVLDLSEAEISYDWTQFKEAREALENKIKEGM